MSTATKTRVTTGVAAVVTGVLLIGTSGLTFVVGWAMWAAGLVVLMAAAPSGGGGGGRRSPRRSRRRNAAPPRRRYSLAG